MSLKTHPHFSFGVVEVTGWKGKNRGDVGKGLIGLRDRQEASTGQLNGDEEDPGCLSPGYGCHTLHYV